MKRTLRVAVVAVLGCLVYSAQPAREARADVADTGRAIANWLPNLIVDVLDIVKLNVSVGEGHALDVRATRALDLGCSNYDVTRYGLNVSEGAVVDEAVEDCGVSVLGFVAGTRERDPHEIGLTLHVIRGGLEAAVNLRKALDAVTGIFFVDLEDDNRDFFE